MTARPIQHITCGRCGRENRGHHGLYIDNGCYGPGTWDEPGWVHVTPSHVVPRDALHDAHNRRAWVRYQVPGSEGAWLCPGCQTDEERPAGERYVTIACERCGRTNRGRLDRDRFPYEEIAEWDEPGWMDYTAARVQTEDGTPDFQVGRSGVVCPGCLTGAEREQADAVQVEEPER